MMVDTHCHLDSSKYEGEVESVIERAQKVGVQLFINPGASPEDLPKAIALAEKYSNIYFTVGIHPSELSNYKDEYLLDYITHPKCIGVGEIGLDYYWGKGEEERALQRQLFHRQLEIAKEYKKPVIIHTRDAVEDTCKIVETHREVEGVFHCFTGVLQFLKYQDRFSYGIGGIITFKNARKLLEAFPKIPKEKVVLETDAPYLAPHPYRGKRNEPAYLPLIRDKIAELWKMSGEEVETITTNNAKRIFQW
ncbi:MAG: hydrolase TatD [Epsilonproteobacteria bacterium]|jgi:TatD DNase family protein|nr:hydrolase TatD [Campylobacterota bacterium]NPA89009.1 TatD family hydrolase [Campylobacterota bacterium]